MVTQLRSTLRIFISHSVHENEFGMRLASDLRRILGSDSVIWYDTTDMQSGDSWAKAIAEQIQRSNVFIILLSHSSLGSRCSTKWSEPLLPHQPQSQHRIPWAYAISNSRGGR
jgi:hypothetical protein